jgi:hypothetical protein
VRHVEEGSEVLIAQPVPAANGRQLRQEVAVRRTLQLPLQLAPREGLERPVPLQPAHEADAVVSAGALDAVLALAVGRVVEAQTRTLLLLLPLEEVRDRPPLKAIDAILPPELLLPQARSVAKRST